ncbi:MAG: phosphoribosylformylglycinamidine synthase subunit PurQ, partial [Haloechinothrix sp.]
VWHRDANLADFDCLILPGGFSYGDYLRAGAVAGRSPVVEALPEFTARGGLVLGSCNGFQILCEAGLLPGALVRNHKLHFVCRDQWLKVENTSTAWTSRYEPGAEILVPVKNGEGAFIADEPTLDKLEGEGRVVFRYVGTNPNGSRRDIAGISDATGRIVGLMPHPEHSIDALTGPSNDGLGVFLSAVDSLAKEAV